MQAHLLPLAVFAVVRSWRWGAAGRVDLLAEEDEDSHRRMERGFL
jgi:hypothetical protein